jgi:small subunit ribosomal protein S17
MPQSKTRGKKKTLIGKVVSDKMDKTIVVQVEYLKEHPVYKRMVKKFSKFKVHDEENKAKTGNIVKISQTRPLSKDKRWRLSEILK